MKHYIAILMLLPPLLSGGSRVAAAQDEIRFVCTQTASDKTETPQEFKISPARAIDLAAPFFIENPFVFIVYADSKYYYVDIASKAASPELAGRRAVKINGVTGKILRSRKRRIGK